MARSAPVVALVAAVAVLAALEIGLRIRAKAIPQLGWTRGLLVQHAEDGWRGRPGVARWVETGAFDVLVESDEAGHRRPEPAPPGEGTHHLLVLGGSTAWGKGVGRGALLSDWLQRDASPSVAVHNRAMQGYSLAEIETALDQAFEERRFDEVLLLLSPSDLVDAGRLGAERDAAGAPWGLSLAVRLEDVSWAARYLRRTWDGFGQSRESRPDPEPGARALAPAEDLSEARERVRSIVERVRAHGARLVLLYAPTQREVAEAGELGPGAARSPQPLRELLAVAAAAADVGFLDVTDQLASPPEGRAPLFHEALGMWSQRAHFLAAQWLADAELLVATRRWSEAPHEVAIEPGHPYIAYDGRTARDEGGGVAFDWPGVAIRVRVEASSVRFRLRSEKGWHYFNVRVDGEARPVARVTPTRRSIEVGGLGPGIHEIELRKRNDGTAPILFSGLELTRGGRLLPPRPRARRQIEVLGASIAQAYGSEGSTYGWSNRGRKARYCGDVRRETDASESFGAVLAGTYGADLHLVAVGGQGIVRSYGERTPDETPYPALYARSLASRPGDGEPLDWAPGLVVSNLGENDFHSQEGLDPVAFRDAYVALLERVRERYPDAYILLFYDEDREGLGPWVEETVRVRRRAGDARIDLLAYPHPARRQMGCNYHPGTAHHRLLARLLGERAERVLGWRPTGEPIAPGAGG